MSDDRSPIPVHRERVHHQRVSTIISSPYNNSRSLLNQSTLSSSQQHDNTLTEGNLHYAQTFKGINKNNNSNNNNSNPLQYRHKRSMSLVSNISNAYNNNNLHHNDSQLNISQANVNNNNNNNTNTSYSNNNNEWMKDIDFIDQHNDLSKDGKYYFQHDLFIELPSLVLKIDYNINDDNTVDSDSSNKHTNSNKKSVLKNNKTKSIQSTQHKQSILSADKKKKLDKLYINDILKQQM